MSKEERRILSCESGSQEDDQVSSMEGEGQRDEKAKATGGDECGGLVRLPAEQGGG